MLIYNLLVSIKSINHVENYYLQVVLEKCVFKRVY